MQTMPGSMSNGSSGDDSLILLDDLDKQVELDSSLIAPLAKLIASSKVSAKGGFLQWFFTFEGDYLYIGFALTAKGICSLVLFLVSHLTCCHTYTVPKLYIGFACQCSD